RSHRGRRSLFPARCRLPPPEGKSPALVGNLSVSRGRIASMLLSRLAQTRIALASTRSRNAKRDLIAEVLREASGDDVEIVVSYLSGSLRQRRTGVGWKSLQSIPTPAAEPALTVGEIDAVFSHVAGLSGPGSTLARAEAVNALLARATADE